MKSPCCNAEIVGGHLSCETVLWRQRRCSECNKPINLELKPKEKTIYDLELHEELSVSKYVTVKRVPNGFLYVLISSIGITSCFVPWESKTETTDAQIKEYYKDELKAHIKDFRQPDKGSEFYYRNHEEEWSIGINYGTEFHKELFKKGYIMHRKTPKECLTERENLIKAVYND